MNYYDVAERVDVFRKYTEQLGGGEVKRGNWKDYFEQAVKIECVVYPEIKSWYFVVPEREELGEAVRFAIRNRGNTGISVTALAVRNGEVIHRKFLSEEGIDMFMSRIGGK